MVNKFPALFSSRQTQAYPPQPFLRHFYIHARPPQTHTPDHFRHGFLAIKFSHAHPRHTPQTTSERFFGCRIYACPPQIILRQFLLRQIQACPPQTIQTNNGSAVKHPRILQHLQAGFHSLSLNLLLYHLPSPDDASSQHSRAQRTVSYCVLALNTAQNKLCSPTFRAPLDAIPPERAAKPPQTASSQRSRAQRTLSYCVLVLK